MNSIESRIENQIKQWYLEREWRIFYPNQFTDILNISEKEAFEALKNLVKKGILYDRVEFFNDDGELIFECNIKQSNSPNLLFIKTQTESTNIFFVLEAVYETIFKNQIIIQEKNILPNLIKTLENYPKEQWLNLIKEAVEKQAQEFEDEAVDYVLNPDVHSIFKLAASKLRTEEQNIAKEKKFSKRCEEKAIKLGLTIDKSNKKD